MQNKTIRVLLLLTVVLSLTGCSVVEGIFKAGMGVGIFIIAILAIILFIVSKLFGRNNQYFLKKLLQATGVFLNSFISVSNTS
jgi:ABC-type transport system involved in cytochrome bd biosynthesis fused ATPase/permease subunit